MVEVSAAGDRFLTRNANGTVRVFELDGHLLSTFDPHARQATLAPDGAIVATGRGRIAELWSATSGNSSTGSSGTDPS